MGGHSCALPCIFPKKNLCLWRNLTTWRSNNDLVPKTNLTTKLKCQELKLSYIILLPNFKFQSFFFIFINDEDEDVEATKKRIDFAYSKNWQIWQLIKHQNLKILVPTPHNYYGIMWARDKIFQVAMSVKLLLLSQML